MSEAAEIHDKSRGLYRVATLLEWFAIVAGVVGVIGGVLLAASSDKSNGATGATTTHPWVGLGLTVMVAAAVNAAFLWALARALVVFAMDVNSRHSNVPLAVAEMRSFGPSTAAAAPAPAAPAAVAPSGARVYRRKSPPPE